VEGPARHLLPVLPAGAADLLGPETGRQVQVIDREVAGLVPRFESPELESKDERSRRTPLDVSFTDEVAESAVRQDVGVLWVVDATAAAEHPCGSRTHVELAPAAARTHGCPGNAGVLSHRAATQPGDRLADERFAQDLGRPELQSRVEGDRALEEAPPDPRRLNTVPPDLAAVILKAMAKKPADRYATASEMHDALARLG